jgi:hypothetical protein
MGMQEAIAGDAINISILLHKYGRTCKTVAENIEARMEHWAHEAFKEGGLLPSK